MNADWEDIKTVLYLVKEGSLAQAGTRLGVNYTTVARRIRRLEADLDQQLFLKAKAGYVPTEAGFEVAKTAEKMEQNNAKMIRSLSSMQTALTGSLTVTAPPLLIGPLLSKVFANFIKQYPDINLNVRATNQNLNLNRPEADVAIRVNNTPDETLVGLRLAKQRSASFASVELAKEIVNNPEMTIPWVGFIDWKNAPKASLRNHPNASVVCRFDDMSAVVGAVEKGMGVARLPMFLGRTWPNVIQVPMLPPTPYWDIWALTHADMKNAPKVSAFKNILIPHFKACAGMLWD